MRNAEWGLLGNIDGDVRYFQIEANRVVVLFPDNYKNQGTCTHKNKKGNCPAEGLRHLDGHAQGVLLPPKEGYSYHECGFNRHKRRSAKNSGS